MKILNYECVTVGCESHDKKLRTVKTTTGTSTKFTKDDQFVIDKDDDDTDPEPCPYCEQPLKLIGENRPLFLGSSLLTMKQKQQSLMKRSKAHERTGEQRDNRAQAMQQSQKEFGK